MCSFLVCANSQMKQHSYPCVDIYCNIWIILLLELSSHRDIWMWTWRACLQHFCASCMNTTGRCGLSTCQIDCNGIGEPLLKQRENQTLGIATWHTYSRLVLLYCAIKDKYKHNIDPQSSVSHWVKLPFRNWRGTIFQCNLHYRISHFFCFPSQLYPQMAICSMHMCNFHLLPRGQSCSSANCQ